MTSRSVGICRAVARPPRKMSAHAGFSKGRRHVPSRSQRLGIAAAATSETRSRRIEPQARPANVSAVATTVRAGCNIR